MADDFIKLGFLAKGGCGCWVPLLLPLLLGLRSGM